MPDLADEVRGVGEALQVCAVRLQLSGAQRARRLSLGPPSSTFSSAVAGCKIVGNERTHACRAAMKDSENSLVRIREKGETRRALD